MPTGHTAGVLDGKITNVKEFAAECARSFLYYMRDESMDAPLRYPERQDSYYAEQLQKNLEKLSEWDSLSEEEKYARWSEYAERRSQEAQKAEDEAEENYLRLAGLMQEVKSILVPGSHHKFRQFMIEQLEETIRFDGTFNEDWYRVIPYEEWTDSRRSHILSNIEYATEGMKKAEENYQESRKWVSTLANLYGLEVKDGE